ncbi:unnamed protein product [Schistosoma curassoni]|uniref:Uncharacterized protein n=1 Tax=Schistosoma curassoni TaxID=6186 RepID=A0A183JG74_9TREM|nr:unnamed protein product [Schistosoma curassoni]
MVEHTGTYVPANIARLGHHDGQARPPRQDGKRAIDTTPGFILSRIRLAIHDPNEPQEEAKSQEIDSDTVVKNSGKDCV